MKKLIAALSTAVFVLAGCQEETFVEPQVSENYFASTETFGSNTKTAIGEGRTVIWKPEDRVAIFEGGGQGNAHQILDSYIGKSYGEFSSVDGLTTDGSADEFEGKIAIYPFSEELSITDARYDSYVITGITFPSVQEYNADSFSDESFPMSALASEGSRSLAFKNIGGILKISLKGTCSVNQISLTGNSGEPLSGRAAVTLDQDGIPTVQMPDDASPSVTLNCEPAVELDPETATAFFISIPPTDFEAGFSITVTDSDNIIRVKKTEKHNKVGRSSILAMPSIGLSSDDIINYGIDYIDEYGINHGRGVKIGDIIWAPVNCGYHATDFKWGKLYQWGRKYGQGYDDKDGTYDDAVIPDIYEEKYGFPLHVVQDKSNANNCYYSASSYYWQYWEDEQINYENLWDPDNKGSYDPCPAGWRVANSNEFDELWKLRVSEYLWTTHNGQYGYWVSGDNKYSEDIPKIFLPAAGYRANTGVGRRRNVGLYYWTSNYAVSPTNATYYSTTSQTVPRTMAFTIRCVQEDPDKVLIPVESLSISQGSLNLNIGEEYQLTAEILPATATWKIIDWYSDNIEIATVDKYGKVTALKEGSATITAMAGMFYAQCTLNVTLPPNN